MSRIETDPVGGARLRLQFERVRDRHGHSIEVVRDGASATVFSSVEDEERDGWPSSPPLQQVRIEHRPEGPVALAIGMARKAHWSVSVELTRDRPGFRFDVACRSPGPPSHLASCYLVSSPLGQHDEGILKLTYGSKLVVLRAVPTPGCPARLTFLEPSSVALTVTDDPFHPERYPATFRWMYEVVLEPPRA